LHACPGTQSAQNEPVVLFSPRGYRLIPLPSRASAKVLRQYYILAAMEAGMAARDTVLRAYGKRVWPPGTRRSWPMPKCCASTTRRQLICRQAPVRNVLCQRTASIAGNGAAAATNNSLGVAKKQSNVLDGVGVPTKRKWWKVACRRQRRCRRQPKENDGSGKTGRGGHH